MSRLYYVYILASGKNGTIYTGVTNNIQQRVSQHKAKINRGFASKYDITRLVYYEKTGSIEAAIAREKQLKNWRRDWKLDLIENINPNWWDLSLDFL